MAFDVKKVAAAGAAAAGVLVLSSGWLVGLCNYQGTVEKARQGIELYLLNSYPELKEQGLSVALYERDGSLFDRKLSLVVTANEDSVNIPLDVAINYGSYDIVFDPIHATINRVNAIKALELDTLTSVKARANIGLFSGKLTFDGSVSYLNDDSALKNYADANAFIEYQDLLKTGKLVKPVKDAKAVAAEPVYTYDASKSKEENLAAFEQFKNQSLTEAERIADMTLTGMASDKLKQLKIDTGFKDVGTAVLSIKVDEQENISTSLDIDSFINQDLGFAGLKSYTKNRGLANLLSVGRNEIQIDKAFFMSSDMIEKVDNTVLKLSSGRVGANGNFDLAYEMKIAKADDFSDLNVNGKLSGLNIHMFNAVGPEDVMQILERNGLDLRVSKGSSVKIPAVVRADKYTEPEMREITVAMDGNITVQPGQKVGLFTVPYVNFNIATDVDVNTIEGSSLNSENLQYFNVNQKTGVSSANLILDPATATMTINGHEVVW